MTSPCSYCHLPRKNLNVLGLCRRCAFVIHVITGHPDLPDPIEGAKSKHAQTLSLGFFDRRRGDGGGRPFGQPGAGPLS